MTRKNIMSIVGIVTAFLFCLLYLFGVALKTPITEPRVYVTVTLPRSGGLYEGSEVTYRGVRVGRVTELRLTDDGVSAKVRLDGSARIPADARPKVRSLSPVGEQYIDFQPEHDGSPYLENGDTIEGTASDLPTSLATTAINLNALIKQIDPKALKTVLRETANGLKGTQDDLQRMVVQGSVLLNEFDKRWAMTDRLITNGDRLLRLGADLVPTFDSITRNTKVFTAWLRKIDPVLVRLLEKAPGQIDELRGLVRDVDDILGDYLDPYVTLADFMAARDPHLRALLRDYPRGFRALSSSVFGGAAHLNGFFEYFEYCGYGADEHPPRDVTRYPAQDDGHCSRSFPASQRGAQWAPGPLR
ncbi:MCE family protein [Nocardioides humilatus]|uniref:MCE family protein n=1 Tax=Nocardioides humilatus TaxID=2607660 RepID=A0A5B1LF97_9ACTN|nr:MlaD family protein [Nocardioides humilatus]KAA1419313.1 MCE family protein [Nocardioides humilatus]